MSQILKAKNRLLNRGKNINQQTNFQSSQQNQCQEQTFDVQPLTYPKKFNISSISMKFQRNSNQENSNYKQSHKNEKSPEFCRTQRINPIRRIQQFNNALSQSNSQSRLGKNSKEKSRRISMTSQLQFSDIPFQATQKSSEVKNYKQRDYIHLNQSPIHKIKKMVHSQPLNLLISKSQNRKAQSPYKPRQCSKQITQNYLKQIQEEKKKFIDSSFPPKITIIYTKKAKQIREYQITFERLKTIYQNQDKQISLIRSCQPTSIQQGQFTNPYFYSALTILAEQPQMVLSIIQNQKNNSNGIYFIRLCKDGTWRYIIVDDFVPIRLYQNKTQFLCTYTLEKYSVCQIWATLLEKALAKVYGSYQDLYKSTNDGICPILRTLTGFPVSKYDLIKDVRSYLVLIDSALKRGHIVVLQQILPQLQQIAQLKSMSSKYSYQILQIQKNCFILRNLSDLQLITRLTYEQVMMFSSLLIFRRQKNYSYISQKLRHKKGYFSMVKIQVSENLSCYFDIWQNNPAYYKGIQYQIYPYKIILQPLQIPSQNLPSYDSKPEQQIIVESGKQISMKKGSYVLSIHLCQNKQLDFTLSFYGQRQVKIQRLKNGTLWHQNCCKQQKSQQ